MKTVFTSAPTPLILVTADPIVILPVVKAFIAMISAAAKLVTPEASRCGTAIVAVPSDGISLSKATVFWSLFSAPEIVPVVYDLAVLVQ